VRPILESLRVSGDDGGVTAVCKTVPNGKQIGSNPICSTIHKLV